MLRTLPLNAQMRMTSKYIVPKLRVIFNHALYCSRYTSSNCRREIKTNPKEKGGVGGGGGGGGVLLAS